MTGAIFRERPNTKTLLQKGVGDTPAKWLFYAGRRFLRLSADGGTFSHPSAETKKAVFKSHI